MFDPVAHLDSVFALMQTLPLDQSRIHAATPAAHSQTAPKELPLSAIARQREANEEDAYQRAKTKCLALLSLESRTHKLLPAWVDEAYIHDAENHVEILMLANQPHQELPEQLQKEIQWTPADPVNYLPNFLRILRAC